MKIKRIGVVANLEKADARRLLERLAGKARALGMETVTDPETARGLRGVRRVSPRSLPGRIDCLLALGGDGTMLYAARLLGGRDRPVLGVNIGGLGFLTSVAGEDLEPALECLARGDFFWSRRSVLEGTAGRGRRTLGKYRALNDLVIGSGAAGRTVTIHLAIGGEKVASYVCDGLIVSTPTGSTGHSLSANGPILSPDTAAFVINPICPHSLSSRPLVVPDTVRMRAVVADCAGELPLTADGQTGLALRVGDRVDIRRSGRSVRFVHLPDYSYFSVLHRKLDWRGSNW